MKHAYLIAEHQGMGRERPIPSRDLDGSSISTDTQTSPSLGFVEPSAFTQYNAEIRRVGGSLPGNFTTTDSDETISYQQSGLGTVSGEVASATDISMMSGISLAVEASESEQEAVHCDNLEDSDLVILTSTESEHTEEQPAVAANTVDEVADDQS